MKIVIAGGTGFLGRSLADALAREPATLQHDVIILTRQRVSSGRPSQPRLLTWAPSGAVGPWAAELDGASAVVNLAGESIAGRRWSDAQKQRILDSRRLATRSLVSAIRQATRPPLVFVSSSAVGYYGPRGDEIVTEDAPAGSDFLARVCLQWEEEAARAEGASHARRSSSHRPRARARWWRASENAAAVLVRGRRARGVGTPVLAVDSSAGLDRSRSLCHSDIRRLRPAERDGAEPGDECRVCSPPGSSAATARATADARVRHESAPGRNGRSAPPLGSARGAGESRSCRIQVHVWSPRGCAPSHVPEAIAAFRNKGRGPGAASCKLMRLTHMEDVG